MARNDLNKDFSLHHPLPSETVLATTALLQYSNEQLNTLFVSWFERMVGEESMDEALDDLCLLLGYGVRSLQSHILYATSTAWWKSRALLISIKFVARILVCSRWERS